jgi:phospholipase/lecithinase/hemolysin
VLKTRAIEYVLQELYRLGARRIGVTSMPYGEGKDACVPRLNRDAETFNEKLNATVKALKRRHADLKIAIFDIYTPLSQLAQDPAAYGTCMFNNAA